MFLELDVPDPANARQMDKVRFVSPEVLTDWQDGDGRVWRGKSITHLALTPQPVRHRQGPFTPVRMGVRNNQGVRLSLADRVEGGGAMDEMDEMDDALLERLGNSLEALGVETEGAVTLEDLVAAVEAAAAETEAPADALVEQLGLRTPARPRPISPAEMRAWARAEAATMSRPDTGRWR